MGDGRWKSVTLAAAGLILLLVGALIPAHYRRTDREILVQAGQDSQTLLAIAGKSITNGNLGTARLLLQTARQWDPQQADALLRDADEQLLQNRALAPWGGPSPWLDRFVASMVPDPTGRPPAVLQWLLPEGVRAALLRPLSASTHPTTMALMGCRRLENTTILPSVSSASGQPFDAALILAGSLVESGRIHPSLMLDLERTATAALKGQSSTPLETGLLELLGAARRLDWDQLTCLAEHCPDRATLKSLVSAAGADGSHWGTVMSAVLMNGQGAPVAAYLDRFSQGGPADLRTALELRSGAVQELLRRGDPVHRARVRGWVVERTGLSGFSNWLAETSMRGPVFALGVKYLLWIDGLFLVVLGLWFGRRVFLSEANIRFEPRPNYPRLLVVTAAAAVLFFLVSERLLVLKSDSPSGQKPRPTPMFTARLRFDIPQSKTPAMNEKIIAMLVAFFVIQLAIYLLGLGRLRYIRGQLVDGAIKLKLLDNEEAMFDAPLYIGIGGSVLALVLRLSGFDEVSLMASYSSTLFGILFCFVLKVVHVRPYRQRLILESSERKLA